MASVREHCGRAALATLFPPDARPRIVASRGVGSNHAARLATLALTDTRGVLNCSSYAQLRVGNDYVCASGLWLVSVRGIFR
jgi:hypothetical protein